MPSGCIWPTAACQPAWVALGELLSGAAGVSQMEHRPNWCKQVDLIENSSQFCFYSHLLCSVTAHVSSGILLAQAAVWWQRLLLWRLAYESSVPVVVPKGQPAPPGVPFPQSMQRSGKNHSKLVVECVVRQNEWVWWKGCPTWSLLVGVGHQEEGSSWREALGLCFLTAASAFARGSQGGQNVPNSLGGSSALAGSVPFPPWGVIPVSQMQYQPIEVWLQK